MLDELDEATRGDALRGLALLARAADSSVRAAGPARGRRRR
jgi:hypothetical protein